MELYIIRHGQSTNNLSMLYDPFDRQVDPPLTDLGFQQAAAVARYVSGSHNIDTWVEQQPSSREVVQGIGLTRLYCSPMLRALQTCLPISQAVSIQPEIWVDIHEHGGMFLSYEDERGLVAYPGMNRAEILAAFPDYVIPPTVTEQGWWKLDAGMEDITTCQARAIRVANALHLQSNSAQRVALVTHGTFADNLIKALLNVLPGNDLRFFHYNTAISRIDFRQDGRTIVRYINRVDHLSPEQVS